MVDIICSIVSSFVKTSSFWNLIAIYACLILFAKSSKYSIKQCYIYDLNRVIEYAIVGAIIGGKVLFALTYFNYEEYTISNIFSGFVFYGGFIGSVLGIHICCKKHNKETLDILDVYVSILPLGQAIGRIGCYFNGCCYGKIYAGFLAWPYNINGEQYYVFPTWFIEALFCFTLFIFFFFKCNKEKSGWYVAYYMIMYASFRFILEFYRGDEIRGIWHGVSTSQAISGIVFTVGCTLRIKIGQKNKINSIIQGRKKYGIQYLSRLFQL